MVDTYVSGAYEEIREGSSPFSDIKFKEPKFFGSFLVFRIFIWVPLGFISPIWICMFI